jgi:hypothetical protein
VLAATGFQERFWKASRTWPGQRPEQGNSGYFAHKRRDALFDCFGAFVRLAQRNRAGMDQSRAVLHVRMQLRQANQSKRTGADSNDHRRAGTA